MKKKTDFYVDSCIWLNLFKKEGDSSKGKPYWQIAREFFDSAENRMFLIFYSGQVLREIESKLPYAEFVDIKQKYLEKNSYFHFIESTSEEICLARKIEDKLILF